MDAWNNVGFASGEMKDPAKDLPFAMVAGVIVVTTLYVLANVAYLSVLTGPEIQNAPEGPRRHGGPPAMSATWAST